MSAPENPPLVYLDGPDDAYLLVTAGSFAAFGGGAVPVMVCRVCGASVPAETQTAHTGWHARLLAAIEAAAG